MQTMTDTSDTTKGPSLSKAQRDALLTWLWPTSRRLWVDPRNGLDSPSSSALGALCRKGLASKEGSAGWTIYYEMTDAGRAARHALEAENGN